MLNVLTLILLFRIQKFQKRSFSTKKYILAAQIHFHILKILLKMVTFRYKNSFDLNS